MIKANELRVGNWVLFDIEEVYEQITPRRLGFISQENGKGHCHPFKPIPLTEEILLKCGFMKHSTNPFWFIKKQICISLVGSIELISWDMQIFKIDLKVENLHQIQNLYFALTCKELNIEL